MADVEATPELVTKLKSGHMLQIEAVNLAGNTVTFPLPLDDASGNSFQKANEGPAGRGSGAGARAARAHFRQKARKGTGRPRSQGPRPRCPERGRDAHC